MRRSPLTRVERARELDERGWVHEAVEARFSIVNDIRGHVACFNMARTKHGRWPRRLKEGRGRLRAILELDERGWVHEAVEARFSIVNDIRGLVACFNTVAAAATTRGSPSGPSAIAARRPEQQQREGIVARAAR